MLFATLACALSSHAAGHSELVSLAHSGKRIVHQMVPENNVIDSMKDASLERNCRYEVDSCTSIKGKQLMNKKGDYVRRCQDYMTSIKTKDLYNIPFVMKKLCKSRTIWKSILHLSPCTLGDSFGRFVSASACGRHPVHFRMQRTLKKRPVEHFAAGLQ